MGFRNCIFAKSSKHYSGRFLLDGGALVGETTGRRLLSVVQCDAGAVRCGAVWCGAGMDVLGL